MTLEEQRTRIRSGCIYSDLTPELVEARKRAVLLTNDYNASFGDGPAGREARWLRSEMAPSSALEAW